MNSSVVNYDSARAKIQSFATLEIDWDSYGGSPIDDKTIERALCILDDLAAGDIPIPQVVPCSSGDIQFEWDPERGAVEIEIGPEGEIGYWFEDDEGEEGGEVDTDKLNELLGFLKFRK